MALQPVQGTINDPFQTTDNASWYQYCPQHGAQGRDAESMNKTGAWSVTHCQVDQAVAGGRDAESASNTGL